MKKVLIIAALLLTPILGFTQNGVFDKFEDKESVSSFVINQKMFRMLASIDIDLDDPEDKEFLEKAKKITSLKVFTTEDDKVSAEMKSTVDKYLKSSELEQLMRFKDGEKVIKFYVKEGKDEHHVEELLMYMTGFKKMLKDQDIEINGEKREFSSLILFLTGDIDLRQISKMTKKMDIPGGEQLKKASEKKN